MCANHAPVVISLNTVLHVPQSSRCLLRVPRWEGGGEKRTRFKVRRSGFKPSLLCPHGLQPSRLLSPWDFPGKNTGVGCYFLLQGIFPTQGSNPCLLHWQADSSPLSELGSKFEFPHCYLTAWCLDVHLI